jgi:hypothetical protein
MKKYQLTIIWVISVIGVFYFFTGGNVFAKTTSSSAPMTLAQYNKLKICSINNFDARVTAKKNGSLVSGYIELINKSGRCRLEGFSGVKIQSKKILDVKIIKSDKAVQKIVLDKNQSARFDFSWSNWCQSAKGPFYFNISLPGKTTIKKIAINDAKSVSLKSGPTCISGKKSSGLSIGPFYGDDGSAGKNTPAITARTLTRTDNGKTFNLKVGERLLLKLGENYNWSFRVDNRAVVDKVNIAAAKGVQRVYEAKKIGLTDASAVGSPLCLSSKPPCKSPSVSFRVHLVVKK